MDIHQNFNFLAILKDSIKLLLFQNGRLMLLVTTISLLFSSIFFLIFDFSSYSLMRDMLFKESLIPLSSSYTSEFTNHYSRIKNKLYISVVYIVFVFFYFIATFLPMIAAIIVSAQPYNDQNLSLKDLSLEIIKSWTRPFVTGFYTTFFVIVYVFFVLSITSPLIKPSNMSALGYSIWIGLIAKIFYLYLSSVWILSLVVSVVDQESYGIDSLWKSVGIIKGQKMSGFLLNIVFSLVYLGVYLGSIEIKGEKYWISNEKIKGLFVVNCCCLVRILTFVVYTVLYFRGKDGNGQEIELNWSNVEYAKLGTTPLGGVP